jgi:predicted nucleic acid-binding protein
MERLKHKHILLDTNILINAAKCKDGFAPFFKILSHNDVQSVIDYGIKFEFLRTSNTEERREIKNRYLDLILGKNRMELFVNSEIIDSAIEIANIYSRKTKNANKQFSFTDCTIVAQMKKYQSSLYLATLDNNDFPIYLMDRIYTHTIDNKQEILNVGIYSFSESKYQQCIEEFSQVDK